jgi:hypothetical protein
LRRKYPLIYEIIRKSLDGTILTKKEIFLLFEVSLFSEESAMIIAASRRKSKIASNGLAEVHAQVGLRRGKGVRDTSCIFWRKSFLSIFLPPLKPNAAAFWFRRCHKFSDHIKPTLKPAIEWNEPPRRLCGGEVH